MKNFSFNKVQDIRTGTYPAFDAWFSHFLVENNLEHSLNSKYIASPEQLRFMVALDEKQIFVPCADALFKDLCSMNQPQKLIREYCRAWKFIIILVKSYKLPRADEQRIIKFCRWRFQGFLRSCAILPARMAKRLVKAVTTFSGDPDPYRKAKQQDNARAQKNLHSKVVQDALYALPEQVGKHTDILQLRHATNLLELARLFRLSTHTALWREASCGIEEIQEELTAPVELAMLEKLFASGNGGEKKILYIPDIAGGFMVDIAIVHALLRQGHQVILVMKDAFYFYTPTIWDLETDPSIKEALGGIFMLEEEAVSKNDLLRYLREHKLVIISDGTSEQLNLYRCSTTFARAWKECDFVFARGERTSEHLLGNSQLFTRDILAWRRGKKDKIFHIEVKKRSPLAYSFSEQALQHMADTIIGHMQEAQKNGKTVMFYSAIIGSVPGQTQTAIRVVNAFVLHLRERLENTFIINPAEHFTEGLDGDDLMYMWERVQRSGLLDVWRFQTVEDIEASFSLLSKKVPSAWSGKDATFSTGCTKEMQIAIDVQGSHPELQIIGPARESFFRRREYGVGQYFDSSIKRNQKIFNSI